MSRDNNRHNSKNSKSQKLNHFQKKISDRQYLEAVYRNKVCESAESKPQSSYQGKPTEIEPLSNIERQVLISYPAEEFQVQQSQQQSPLLQGSNQTQQPIVVYVPNDQNRYPQTATDIVPISQNLNFDINQLVSESQDFNFENSSQHTEHQGFYLVENSTTPISQGSDYGLLIKGPSDISTSNATIGRPSNCSTPSTMMFRSQQQQQQSPSRYDTASSSRAQQMSSLPLTPGRDELELQRGLMSPASPRSFESQSSPNRRDAVITTATTKEIPRAYSPYIPTAGSSNSVDHLYVPSPCKNITSTSTLYVPSVGKKLSFKDRNTVCNSKPDNDNNNDDNNEELEEEIDTNSNKAEDNQKQLSTKQLFKIYNKVVLPDKDDTIMNLKVFMDSSCHGTEQEADDNLFAVDEHKIRLLSLVGKYSDKRNNNHRFASGFTNLYKNNVPDLENLWSEIKHNRSFIDLLNSKIPSSVQWLFVQLAICYSRCTDTSGDSFIIPVISHLKKMKGKSPSAILQMAASLNSSLGKCMKRKQIFGDDINESDFAEPPSPAQRKRKRTYYNSGDGVESDTASIVSVSMGQNHRSPRRMPLLSTRHTVNLSLPENEVYDIYTGLNGLTYEPTNQPIEQQGRVCTAKPNLYLCTATKDVILHTIKTKDQGIAFTDMTDVFVNEITKSIFGNPILNLANMCQRIKDVEDESGRLAMAFCMNLRSLVMTRTQITFEAVMGWCRVYCTTLSQVLCRVSEKIGTCDVNILRTRLKEEYPNIIATMEVETTTIMKEYTHAFHGLARISDWCVYTLFGVCLNERGDAVDTSVLVRNILLCWITLQKLPVHLNKEETERLNKVLWCIPLAHLTKLGGFGIPLEEVKKPAVCGLDEYLDAI